MRLKKLALCLCLVAGAALASGGKQQAGAAPVRDSASAAQALARSLEDLPRDKHGEMVRLGHRIFTRTAESARRYSGNGLSCSNCHLEAGTRSHAAPMWAAWGMYPAYLAKTDRVNTFEERVQQCFRFSLNGFPPTIDSHEMRAIVAYAQWLARGVPIGLEQVGRGFPTLARTGSDPNPLRGRELFVKRCADCHGESGQGRKESGTVYNVPPVWGFDSFNKGAGLARVDLLAGFLKANMPQDNPDLSDQEALDIAAWIGLQERWPDPRKGFLRGVLEK
jgi:thiosulfate dehydrogenase